MCTCQKIVNKSASGCENSAFLLNNHLGQGFLIQFVNGLLCPENAELIKLLLRDCSCKEYSEKDLIALELNRNMTEGKLLDNYGFSISEIKSRCKNLWGKSVDPGKMGDKNTRFELSKRTRIVLDPDEFLYWTFLLILHDGIENPYPFTLYKMIAAKRLQKYYSVKPVFI